MNGKALTFTLIGTRGDNLVIQDRETQSRWQQATGEAFSGPLTGAHLPLVPFLLTSWKKWRSDHPETLAVVPDSSDQPDYQRMEQSIAQPFWETQPAPGALRLDSRLPTHEMVIGLEVDGAWSAYPVETVHSQQVINDRVGSVPVLIVYTSSTDTVTAFSRRLEGRTVSFKPSGAEELADIETGSVWNSDGLCLRGGLRGKKLDFITPLPSFWFAWAEFHPDTRVYVGP